MAAKFCTECGNKLDADGKCTRCEMQKYAENNMHVYVDTPNPFYNSDTGESTPPMAMMGMGGMSMFQAMGSPMAFNGSFNNGAFGRADIDRDTLKPLSNVAFFQGIWRFEQLGNEAPEELQYTDMYVMINDNAYTVVKDSVKVDSGTLGENIFGNIASENGKIYVFDYMKRKGGSGDEMTAHTKSTYVNVCRVVKDFKSEFDRTVSMEFGSIDVFCTDEDNRVKYQLYIENNLTYMMIYKGRHGILIEDDVLNKIAEDVKLIMADSELYKFEKRTEMPGSGIMSDCFSLRYKSKEGLTWSLKFREEIPKEAERVAAEIDKLYQKYDLEKRVKKSVTPEELAGVWASEDKSTKLILGADNTYQLGNTSGTYCIEGDYIMPTDVLANWDLYGQQNRYEMFRHFGNIKICGAYLEGNIFVCDGDTMVVNLYREVNSQ